MQPSVWSLYMIHYSPNAIYTGITTDITRRLQQHQLGNGAKCLRGKQNLQLIYHCQIGEKGMALKIEYRIKQLSHAKKVWLSQTINSCSALQHYLKISHDIPLLVE